MSTPEWELEFYEEDGREPVLDFLRGLDEVKEQALGQQRDPAARLLPRPRQKGGPAAARLRQGQGAEPQAPEHGDQARQATPDTLAGKAQTLTNM
jgi:hypothetical protein